MTDLRLIQLARLNKLARMFEDDTPGLPAYSGGRLDLFGTFKCTRQPGRPSKPLKFSVCLNCTRFDRLNMICRVGRLRP